jgi:hypothetical protein
MTEEKRIAREKILVKVRALLARTADRGCTEAEASAALEKANELMAEYDISFADAQELKDEVKFGARRASYADPTKKRKFFHEAVRIYTAIGRYYDCECWRDRQSGEIVFFGTASDTNFAHYLLTSLIAVGETEWKKFAASEDAELSGLHGKSLRSSFFFGYVSRLIKRLDELKASREAKVEAAGSKALVVVKKQEVDRFFGIFKGQTGLNLVSGRNKVVVRDAGARAAGAAAADRANINAGVIGGNKQKLIG